MFFNLFNLTYLVLLTLLTKVVPSKYQYILFTCFGIVFVSYYSIESVVALIVCSLILLILNSGLSPLRDKYQLAIGVLCYVICIWYFSIQIQDNFPYELLVLMWFNLARYWHVWIDYIREKKSISNSDLLSYLWFPTILFAGPMETYQDYNRFKQKPVKTDYEQVMTLLFTAFLSGSMSFLINEYLKSYSIGFSNESVSSVFMYVNCNAILIFFDMSSWICLSRAFAHIMGYPFDSTNFKLFFLSKNPVQFWNRWNMSFTRWIQKYIFTNNLTLFMNNRRRIITWTLLWFVCCGLLHKYSMQFVIWGSLHAVGIIVTHAFLPYKMKMQTLRYFRPKPYRIFTIFLTMLFLHVTCIFMSPNYSEILQRYLQLLNELFGL